MAEAKNPTAAPLPKPDSTTSTEPDELTLLRVRVAKLENDLEELARSRRREDADDEFETSARSSRSDSGSSRRSRSTSSRRSERRRSSVSRRDDDEDRPADKKLADSFRDVSDRSTDEAHKLVRGMTLAYIEHLRTVADAANDFVDEVLDRNNPDERDNVRDLSTSLPSDIYSGLANAMDRVLDAPSRAVDRFNESYREAEDVEDSDRSDRSDRSRRSSSRRSSSRDDRDDRGYRYARETRSSDRADDYDRSERLYRS
ncbi:MAG TPA: hypothetical protein VF588_05045 [Pyrinomonadaceae bacterium]|jgi:hypothetical protein